MFRIHDEDFSYLNGTTFSSIYQLKLKKDSAFQTKMELIHFGCADHVSLIEQKRKANQWLHEILAGICNKEIRVDITVKGMEYMNKAGFESYLSNVITDIPPVASSM